MATWTGPNREMGCVGKRQLGKQTKEDPIVVGTEQTVKDSPCSEKLVAYKADKRCERKLRHKELK